MFERFTDRARKVMALANQEASRLDMPQIATEHILLGLLREGGGVGANVLKNLGFDLVTARSELETLIPKGEDLAVDDGKLPPTPRSKKVIEYAIEEARALRHRYVGTEHLLLGLVREETGVAAQLLMRRGLTPQIVRDETINLLGVGIDEVPESPSPPDQPSPQTVPSVTDVVSAAPLGIQTSAADSPLFRRFTPRAHRVMALAKEEAQRLRTPHIGTDHLLLGLVAEGTGIGATVLRNFGVHLRTARLELEKLVATGSGPATAGPLPLTPRAKQVVLHATEEARALNHHYVGSEHLLLGLLRQHDGVAADLLLAVGVNFDAARLQTLDLLGAGVEEDPLRAATTALAPAPPVNPLTTSVSTPAASAHYTLGELVPDDIGPAPVFSYAKSPSRDAASLSRRRCIDVALGAVAGIVYASQDPGSRSNSIAILVLLLCVLALRLSRPPGRNDG